MELILFNKRYNKEFCEFVIDLINNNKYNSIKNLYKSCDIIELNFVENYSKTYHFLISIIL